MDRISELPEDIIKHIISFLIYKEAARSTILSKLFLNAWNTRQFLDFDETHFAGMQINDKHTFLLKFVDETLERYTAENISIQKLRLKIESIGDDRFIPFFEKWLQVVLKNDVVELDLCTRWKSNIIPPEIFGLNSLKELRLVGRQHRVLSLVLKDTDIKCCNLKRLTLNKVQMDEATFHNLMYCCSLIEELVITHFGNFNVHIANLPKLELPGLRYKGVNHMSINIDAPKLQYLICSQTVNIIEPGNILSLMLCDSFIGDEQLRILLSELSFLKDLILKRCSKLIQLKVSSHSLVFIDIIKCVKLVEAIIDAPNLGTVKYYDCGKTFLLITSPRSIPSGVIRIDCFDEIDATWFDKLRGLLSIFRKSHVEISLKREINFNSEGFRAVPLSYGHVVGTLKVKYKDTVCFEHLDGLLSLCHPKTVFCDYLDTKSNDASIRDFCKMLKSSKVPKCCNSDEIKCWLHYLRDAELYYLKGNEKEPIHTGFSSFCDLFNVLTLKRDSLRNVSVCFYLKWKREKKQLLCSSFAQTDLLK